MNDIQTLFAAQLEKLGAQDAAALLDANSYIGSDGIPRCRKCGAPVAHRLSLNGHYVPAVCNCEQLRRAAEHRDREQKELERKMKAISIADKRHFQATFDAFQCRNADDEKLLKALKRYVDRWEEERNGKGVMLYGSVGTGKTFAASCVFNALLERGNNAVIMDVGRLLDFPPDDFREALATIQRVDFLVLDDFGTENETKSNMSKLYKIINTRYNSMRPTWITTNFPAVPDKRDTQKVRIWSRIQEMCKDVLVAGDDRRTKH